MKQYFIKYNPIMDYVIAFYCDNVWVGYDIAHTLEKAKEIGQEFISK